jgi:hypothetical protein
MRRFLKFWKIIVLDILGIIFMIAAILTGWLPGPGGIPLFIVGLSLFAINHEWAERYIDVLKKYADRLGDLIFIETPGWQLFYDIISPVAVIAGIYTLVNQSAIWMVSLGIFLVGIGVTFFLGNRHRYREAKKKLLRKR